ncbi:MAG: hypothetical protein ACQCXQ_14445 [Verrucomicrobiales bacterium]|nr:hypothetical protein [Verrucomicrobiota bacterium JB025]
MANVFGILTAIVLALAGFVALKNQKAYETEISVKETELSNLARSQDRFKSAQDQLASTTDKRVEVENHTAKLTEDESAQKSTNADLAVQIDEKGSTKDSNQARLDEVRERTEKIGEIPELASKMQGLNSEIEELGQNIMSAEATLANLEAQNNQVSKEVAAMQSKFDIMSQGKSLPGLSTSIRSIYPNWGFVTLAAGNNAGVVTGSKLDVVRGGTAVAQLLVTSVERSSASASIVPGSMGEDVTLMVGDQVIPSASDEK